MQGYIVYNIAHYMATLITIKLFCIGANSINVRPYSI